MFKYFLLRRILVFLLFLVLFLHLDSAAISRVPVFVCDLARRIAFINTPAFTQTCTLLHNPLFF